MERFTDAVCQAPEWLKSSWRDCLETPNRLHYGVLRVCATGRMITFFGAWRHQKKRHPTRTATFQTVSLRLSKKSD